MLDAVIYDGLRTPFGRHAGALSSVRPDDLAVQLIKSLISRHPTLAEAIEDVILGNVCQSGEDSRNIARFVGLMAGIPIQAGGVTVNRLCGSGMSAALSAARSVSVGEGNLYLAGGVESMTRAPFVVAKSPKAWDRQPEIYDATIGTRFPNPEMARLFGDFAMPETADNLAIDFEITRDQADAYAVRSQVAYESARARGFFTNEITSVSIPQHKSEPLIIDTDEHPRPGTTLEKAARLKPIYSGGVTTAANASGVNDGAAALLIGGGLKSVRPRAHILSGAIAGVEPRTMGIGPAYAVPKALARAGLCLDDMDIIEINEAFATQVLACCKQLNLAPDDSRLNVNGGAIAIGHPLGASGTRIILTAMRALEETEGRYACLSMCVGVGQGIAMVIERARD